MFSNVVQYNVLNSFGRLEVLQSCEGSLVILIVLSGHTVREIS